MKLDRLDIPFVVIIIGIILLLVDLSLDSTFGFDISMRPGMWAGVGISAIGLTGLAIGTCTS